MAEEAGGDKERAEGQQGWEECSPSWVDRFASWLNRLPGPNWPYYSGMGMWLFSSCSVHFSELSLVADCDCARENEITDGCDADLLLSNWQHT